MSIKKNLGNRIREIRIRRSLTQEALAEKINLSAKKSFYLFSACYYKNS